MRVNEYLNYSHGTTLQSFCEQVLNSTGENRHMFLEWISVEKETMRKKQPTGWEIPVSMQCYYSCLEKIENVLQRNAVTEELPALLEEIKALTRTKIYALFLTQEPACWPSLESVYAAAQENEDYEVAVVYTPYFHQNFSEQIDYRDEYWEMGVPVFRHNEFDLPQYSPDIVFMIKPYGNVPELYQINHVESVIPRVVYIPYGMEITMDLIRFGFRYYAHYRVWKHCAYGEIVKEYGSKFGYRGGENIAVWGHPKADHYIDTEKNREKIPEEWKQRIGSRKTILWTPHHLIDLDSTGTGTWLIWGEKILETALAHPDIFFIIRPHPLMMGALVNNGGLTKTEVDKIREKIDSAENLLWDTNSTYHAAFNAADAIITDGTTFSVEFLYTKKPILLTPRNMEGFYMYEDMLQSYYIVNRIQDVSDFMEMIRDEKDPLKEKRLALYKKTFYIPEEGTVGENILRQIKIELEKECRKVDSNATSVRVEASTDKLPENNTEDLDEMQFPLFSILVLCYKNMNLLFGMLDSIFRQDYPRIQLVVSDDGSEDFDVETVQAYIDSHKRHNIEQVIVRTNETNMRTVPHIHKAISYVTGDYFVFTAADDRFHGTNVISSYVEQFLSKPEKVWLVARCNMTSADYKKVNYVSPTDVDAPFFLADDAQRLFSRWSRRGMAIPCCMAFRKDALDIVGGFDLDYLFLEDWPMVLKLLRNGHAPIYFDTVTAIHSMGGISNSNNRYGKELRRLFYEDKYTIFRKEVNPHLDLLTPEDKKLYKIYLKEIMERHYFFYIDWPDTNTLQRLLLCLKKPIRFWWVFEQRFVKIQNKIPKKKMLLASQVLLLLSLMFLYFNIEHAVGYLFTAMGWLYLCAGLLMMIAGILAYPLQKHFKKKAKLRNNLVN